MPSGTLRRLKDDKVLNALKMSLIHFLDMCVDMFDMYDVA